MTEPATPQIITVPQVTITAPCCPTDPNPGGYTKRHIDIDLTAAQAQGFKRLLGGLLVHRAALRNGRQVATLPDAVRWTAEQLAEAPEQPEQPDARTTPQPGKTKRRSQ